MRRRARTTNPSTLRSRAANARAARVLGGIRLDAALDARLRAHTAATGQTAADFVRARIRELPLP